MSGFVEDPFQMDEDIRETPETLQIVQNDIAPRYNPTDADVEILYKDNQTIRTRIEQLKIQEGLASNPNNNTTEEDDEEDIDDKPDKDLQARLAREYKESLNAYNETKELTPPENFAPVVNTIYRSSFPQPANFLFLVKLKLKSILCLIPEEYPDLNLQFLKEHNIKLFQLGMSGNKEPFVKISSDLITEALKIVMNPENHPILIHCNRGKHRTGCLVGVLRRLQRWSLTMTFDEYRKFAAPKERPMDQQFIELYDSREIIEYALENKFLPLSWA